MKNRLLFSFLMLFVAFPLLAQDFEIVSVESLPADFSAREEIKTDHNDRQCALLRLATQNIVPEQREGFTFKTDLGSEIVERASRNGEIWLWVSPGLKYLRIMHRDLGQYELRLPDHVSRVEALHTYKITIKGTSVASVQTPEKEIPTQQYLAFRLSPSSATLFVNDEIWEVGSDGTAVRFVNFGTYNYRVMAPNYHSQTGTVTVNDPDNTQTVSVSLQPDFIEVTLKVDADAEIWVNNEMKGVRTWTGALGKGTYKIECKQSGHETTVTTQQITDGLNGKTINLPTPKPIYGSLNIESVPNFAKIYIDEKEVGETPKYFPEILMGSHDIKLVKEGYADYTETVTITKGERKQVKASMRTAENNGNYVGKIGTCPTGAINGKFTINASGGKVYFSQGNLQYQASTNTWRFAENQYDYIGDANSNISASYSGWIDLFGWGTSGWNNGNTYYHPWDSNNSNSSLYGPPGQYDLTGSYANSDWGYYNAISNGGNSTHQWRTLTHEEWAYVFNTRSTSSGIRYVKAQVNGVNGVILLPDDWSTSYYSLNSINNGDVSFSSNVISASSWTSSLQSHGAVFLPAAGYRNGTSVSNVGSNGLYWSASYYNSYSAYGVYFYDSYLDADSSNYRNSGRSVRLACPAEN